MKKILLLITCLYIISFVSAQDEPVPPPKKKKDWSQVQLTGRANDHFMIQYGVANWASKPDSINTGGFSRSFNMYFLLDFPFKTDPRFSVAFGPGFGTDHIFFDNTNVTITNRLTPVQFQNVKDTNHFDKYKLSTAYLELPVELRFSSDPTNNGKSLKFALGAKVGLLVSAATKGKNWVNKNGNTVTGFSDKFVQKQKDKYFFNGNRLVGTFRVGYGVISLLGTYQITTLFKEGLGPEVRPYTVGLTISGL